MSKRGWRSQVARLNVENPPCQLIEQLTQGLGVVPYMPRQASRWITCKLFMFIWSTAWRREGVSSSMCASSVATFQTPAAHRLREWLSVSRTQKQLSGKTTSCSSSVFWSEAVMAETRHAFPIKRVNSHHLSHTRGMSFSSPGPKNIHLVHRVLNTKQPMKYHQRSSSPLLGPAFSCHFLPPFPSAARRLQPGISCKWAWTTAREREGGGHPSL